MASQEVPLDVSHFKGKQRAISPTPDNPSFENAEARLKEAGKSFVSRDEDTIIPDAEDERLESPVQDNPIILTQVPRPLGYPPDHNLTGSPSCRPTNDTRSKLSEKHRWMIEMKYFRNWSNSQIASGLANRQRKPGQPPKSTSDANVSKMVRSAAVKWYREHKARRPWKVLSRAEQIYAKSHDLGEEDYPLIDPDEPQKDESTPEASTQEPSNNSQNKIARYGDIDDVENMEGEASASGVRSRGIPGTVDDVEQYKGLTGRNATRKLYKTLELKGERMLEHGPDPYKFGDALPYQITNIDRFHAAANTAGDLLAVSVSNSPRVKWNVRKGAIIASCKAHDSSIDIKWATDIQVDERIMQAFLETISPFPRRHLPSSIIKFYHPDLTKYPDYFGLMDDANPSGGTPFYEFVKVAWNLVDCLELYRIAMFFDCDHVRDLAVSRMHWLHQEASLNKDTLLEESLRELIDGKHLPKVDAEKDTLFLRFWADVVSESGATIPESIAQPYLDALLARAETREWGVEKPRLDKPTLELFCRRYHHHHPESCPTDFNGLDKKYLDGVDELYGLLRKRQDEEDTARLEMIEAVQPYDQRRVDRQRSFAYIMQRALAQELHIMKARVMVEVLGGRIEELRRENVDLGSLEQEHHLWTQSRVGREDKILRWFDSWDAGRLVDFPRESEDDEWP